MSFFGAEGKEPSFERERKKREGEKEREREKKGKSTAGLRFWV